MFQRDRHHKTRIRRRALAHTHDDGVVRQRGEGAVHAARARRDVLVPLVADHQRRVVGARDLVALDHGVGAGAPAALDVRAGARRVEARLADLRRVGARRRCARARRVVDVEAVGAAGRRATSGVLGYVVDGEGKLSAVIGVAESAGEEGNEGEEEGGWCLHLGGMFVCLSVLCLFGLCWIADDEEKEDEELQDFVSVTREKVLYFVIGIVVPEMWMQCGCW